MQEAQLRNQQLTEQLEVMERVVAQKAQATSAVSLCLTSPKKSPQIIIRFQIQYIRSVVVFEKSPYGKGAQVNNQQLTEQLEVMERVVAQKAQATSAVS